MWLVAWHKVCRIYFMYHPNAIFAEMKSFYFTSAYIKYNFWRFFLVFGTFRKWVVFLRLVTMPFIPISQFFSFFSSFILTQPNWQCQISDPCTIFGVFWSFKAHLSVYSSFTAVIQCLSFSSLKWIAWLQISNMLLHRD